MGCTEDAVAFADGGFGAGGVCRVGGVEREGEAIEEAAAGAGAIHEQAIHRGGEPEDAQPLREGERGGVGAIDADEAAARPIRCMP